MPDQNNAPERIWIKPCDPCENPYDYYVCDPRYLDGRETSYVKSIVSCAGCGGGLKRQYGQFVCRDCGKAETVQEVLARADRAAPEGQSYFGPMGIPHWSSALTPQSAAPEWQVRGANRSDGGFSDPAPPTAAPTDNTALIEALLAEVRDKGLIYWEPNTTRGYVQKADMLRRIDAALASREAPPASQQEAEGVADAQATVADHDAIQIANIGNYYGGLNLKREGGQDFWCIKDWDGMDWEPCEPAVAAALRALDGEQK